MLCSHRAPGAERSGVRRAQRPGRTETIWIGSHPTDSRPCSQSYDTPGRGVLRQWRLWAPARARCSRRPASIVMGRVLTQQSDQRRSERHASDASRSELPCRGAVRAKDQRSRPGPRSGAEWGAPRLAAGRVGWHGRSVLASCPVTHPAEGWGWCSSLRMRSMRRCEHRPHTAARSRTPPRVPLPPVRPSRSMRFDTLRSHRSPCRHWSKSRCKSGADSTMRR